jgi:hypothetical protein
VPKADRNKVLRIRKLGVRGHGKLNQRGNAFRDGTLRVQLWDELRTAESLVKYSAGMG